MPDLAGTTVTSGVKSTPLSLFVQAKCKYYNNNTALVNPGLYLSQFMQSAARATFPHPQAAPFGKSVHK
jgi:hypothetical protein